MDLRQKILEIIEYVRPEIIEKEEVANEIEAEIRTYLTPLAEKQNIPLEQLFQEVIQIATDKELLDTYKGVDPKELLHYCILRVKKKYKPRQVVAEEVCIIPFGLSTVRKVEENPYCILYALKREGTSYSPIRIFFREHLRSKVNEIEFFAKYSNVKLDNRGVIYEALNETEFGEYKPLSVEPEQFFVEILPKYGVTVKKISAFSEFLQPSNLSKTSQTGLPEDFDLRIISGTVIRKSVNEQRERVIYTLYDGLTDEPISDSENSIVITGEIPVFAHMRFGEYASEEGYDDYLMCVGQVSKFGSSPEIFMLAIYVAPKLRV